MKILVVDDDSSMLSSVERFLKRRGFSVITSREPANILDIVKNEEIGVVLSDILMPRCSGVELLKTVKAWDPLVEVILMTGHYTIEAAVEAVKLGAYDYLPKPLDLERLEADLSAISAEHDRRRRAGEIEKQMLDCYSFQGMIGKSPAMLSLFSMLKRVAPHYSTALITGETGTGKELAARALHRLSPRSSRRFVVCNCATLVKDLLESELFGHVKGAFTGAAASRAGLFEHADGGTLFLDEIGELPFSLQAKLLRALENREVQRVGSNEVTKVDVRIVAATNRDLAAEVEKGTFRRDLYYRLSAIEVLLPPLRDRREDIPLLCDLFLRTFGERFGKAVKGVSLPAKDLLMRYGWEGNVRQLQNVMERAVMMAAADFVSVSDLPEYLRGPHDPGTGEDDLTLSGVEKTVIEKALRQAGGNKQQAARALGLTRQALYRKLKRYQIV